MTNTLLHPEAAFYQPTTRDSEAQRVVSWLDWLVLSLQLNQQAKQEAPEQKLDDQKVHSKQSLLRLDWYLKRAKENNTPIANILEEVAHDLAHISSETILVEKIKYWQTTIDAQEKLLSGGYTKDLLAMTLTFQKLVSENGGNATRSLLETLKTEQLKATALAEYQRKKDKPLDTKQRVFIWISPPGKESAHYHGVDSMEHWDKLESHHSFVYVSWFEAEENSQTVTIHTHQLRGYPNMRQLLAFAHELHPNPQEADWPTLPQDIEGDIDTWLIGLPLTLEIEQGTQQDVVQQVYQVMCATQKDWHPIWSLIPDIDHEAYQEKFAELVENYYLPLLEKQLPTLLSPDTSVRQQAAIISELDIAFQVLRGSLKKWVDIHDTNKKANAFRTIQRLTNPDKELQQLPATIQQLFRNKTALIPTDESVQETYELHLRAVGTTKPLSLAEYLRYLVLMNNNVALLFDPFSKAQCAVGAMVNLGTGFKFVDIALAGPTGMSVASPELLSSQERRELLELFDEYVPLYIDGKEFPYIVPSVYVGLCYVGEGGAVYGPCDFQLDLDPLVLKMSHAEYYAWKKQLQKEVVSDEILPLLDDSTLPEEQKVLIMQFLFDTLIRDTVDLTQFLAGDVVRDEMLYSKELFEIVAMLKGSTNPIELLQIMIAGAEFDEKSEGTTKTLRLPAKANLAYNSEQWQTQL